MKNLITLLIALGCYLPTIKAQDYKPMLANVNEWQLTDCFEGVCNTNAYYTDGDTIVNNQSYKILEGYHYISRTFLLREDITTQQVFMLSLYNGNQTEKLLYDFSLEVGDVFTMNNVITPFPEEGGDFMLTKIELNELEDGNEYKRYFFSPTANNTASNWQAIWVEGVGSLAIPNAPGGEPNFNAAGQVSCAFRDGELFYTDFRVLSECLPPQLTTPEVVLNTPVISNRNQTLYISNAEIFQNITLFSLQGKRVAQVKNNTAQRTEINVSHLKNGIYIIKFEGVDSTPRYVKTIIS